MSQNWINLGRRATYVDIPSGAFVADVATLVYISPSSLACSLNESVCALTNSVWILTTSSKFFAWLSFCTNESGAVTLSVAWLISFLFRSVLAHGDACMTLRSQLK